MEVGTMIGDMYEFLENSYIVITSNPYQGEGYVMVDYIIYDEPEFIPKPSSFALWNLGGYRKLSQEEAMLVRLSQ